VDIVEKAANRDAGSTAPLMQDPVANRPLAWAVQLWKFAGRKPLGALSGVVLILICVGAVAAPWLAPHAPNRQLRGTPMATPGTRTPDGSLLLLGSDQLGRDMLSRILYGARNSLGIGVLAVLLSLTGGTLLGLVSGYFGGKTDLILQRAVDAWMTLPGLILALLLVAVIGTGISNLVIAITVTSIPRVSRVIRGTTMAVKEFSYVEAAKATGCSHLRIMLVHILPNIMAPIIIIATSALGAAILTESSLSFLGLGIPPPTPTWGKMISDGRQYMMSSVGILLIPALALSATMFALNLLGDALRDILDPRLRGT
jgi:peptide/nickel transport system permease protein